MPFDSLEGTTRVKKKVVVPRKTGTPRAIVFLVSRVAGSIDAPVMNLLQTVETTRNGEARVRIPYSPHAEGYWEILTSNVPLPESFWKALPPVFIEPAKREDEEKDESLFYGLWLKYGSEPGFEVGILLMVSMIYGLVKVTTFILSLWATFKKRR